MIAKRSPRTGTVPAEKGHVCPAWAGTLLCCPLRRLFESPERLLGRHVTSGATVLEPGSGMGYFTLPLARMVGSSGRVLAVDLQPKMIEGLKRRARRAGVLDRIEASVCAGDDLGLGRWERRVDVALAIHVLHEVPDPRRFLEQVFAALRPGGRLLLLEPKGHVSREELEKEVALSEGVGFHRVEGAVHRRSHGTLFERPPDSVSGSSDSSAVPDRS